MFFWIISLCLMVTEAPTVSISGQVVDEAGRSIQGAVVDVWAYHPRDQDLTIFPSNRYERFVLPRTDQDGRFQLNHIPTNLDFKLIVGARNYQGKLTDYFDPNKETRLKIELGAIPTADEKTRLIPVRVIDAVGNPISGVLLTAYSARRRTLFSGGPLSVTPLTLTDDNGNARLSAERDIVAFKVGTQAADFAPAFGEWTQEKDGPMTIELGPGAAMRGRLVFNGQPIRNARVAIASTNRSDAHTAQETETHDDGSFQFDNLPPERGYAIYTRMVQDIPEALPVTLINLPKHGQCAEFDDIAAEPVRKLTFTIRTMKPVELPARSFIYVRRDHAWHAARLELDTQGTDRVTVSVPAVVDELVQLRVAVPGYKVLRTVPNLPLSSRGTFPIHIDEMQNLVIAIIKEEK